MAPTSRCSVKLPGRGAAALVGALAAAGSAASACSLRCSRSCAMRMKWLNTATASVCTLGHHLLQAYAAKWPGMTPAQKHIHMQQNGRGGAQTRPRLHQTLSSRQQCAHPLRSLLPDDKLVERAHDLPGRRHAGRLQRAEGGAVGAAAAKIWDRRHRLLIDVPLRQQQGLTLPQTLTAAK